MNIHPSAIIETGAEIDPTATIGPYSLVEKGVVVGPECRIAAHVVLSGLTTIGARTSIGSFATIGVPPQDLKYQGEPTRVSIGEDNQIREYVSIHRGTPGGRGITTLGNGNLLMAYTHVAHDCLVGNQVIMANVATLGGHVEVGDKATIGGLAAVHQFARVGEYAYVGGVSAITKDAPPYMVIAGIRNRMRISGVNSVGLRRSGFSNAEIRKLIEAHRLIFRSGFLLEEALARTLAEISDSGPVARLVEFFRTSKRGVARVGGDDGE